MFQKPSEPKPGSSDTKVRPLASELATAAADASSSSTASTSPQQVAPATTTTSDYSRLDGHQPPQLTQVQNRQPQQQPNKLSYSVNKQQIAATALHQHYLNYFNSSIPKEGAKSHRTRGSISQSLSQTRQLLQQQHQQLQQAVFPNQDHHPPPHQPDHPNVPPPVVANQRTHHSQQHHNHINNIPATSNYHHPPNNQHNHHYASPSNQTTASVTIMSRSAPRDTDTLMSHKMTQQLQQQQPQKQMNPTLNHRTYSTGAIASSHPQQQQQYQSHSMNPNKQQQHATTKILARSTRHGQLDKDSEDKVAAIKGELENDLEGYKNSELEAISSLERNLPIELSFIIRQQAHCMARMNYLDRQLRELRESAFHLQQQHQHHPHRQQVDAANQVSSTSIMNQGHHHNLNVSRQHAGVHMQTATTMSHTKNGNFILSDDSGGEYSRATISDDDELSSLLDQIAKSIRPDQQQRPMMTSSAADVLLSGQMHNLQQQQQQRITANYATFMGNPPPTLLQHQQQQQQQSYAIINPNQMHHHQQAVPIFVMGSPIAVAHPSSISSNILPGVHFQPEPRYNQYYEDFYNTNSAAPHSVMATIPVPSAPPPPMQHRAFNSSGGNNGFRSQQFDSSMSTVEQLVSQKEKRQIISQLKSADNWLKMRASSQEQQESTPSMKASKQSAAAVLSSHQGDIGQTTILPSANGSELRTNSSSTIKQDGGDRVIDESVDE